MESGYVFHLVMQIPPAALWVDTKGVGLVLEVRSETDKHLCAANSKQHFFLSFYLK